ncbi:hypothetical protein T439DRAFT_327737 [Meredithblackwellia eburnea MCA 4105]
MGESRVDLINWINDLLQLNITKVEQCGAGGIYCQIIDSIYGDVPMAKVKMAAKQEYEYLANFKVLQAVFKSHGIDKPIPVDRLVKCKMQDNLEFLQWLKKYWDLNFPGGEYDPLSRRKGAGGPVATAPTTTARTAPTRAPVARTTAGTTTAPVRRTTPATRPSATSGTTTSRSSSTVPDAALQLLTQQMGEMKLNVEGLEKERDFYFNKLRDIEIIIGARLEIADTVDADGVSEVSEAEREQLLQIQGILYSTEDGFEVPDQEEGGLALEDEEETF